VPARRAAGSTLNTNKTCEQGDCRIATVQRRPAAHSWWIATVRGGSVTLGSRAATVPSDPTTQCHVAHASDAAGRQDVTTSMPLKTPFASPRRQDPMQ
jgi:hypothetical protein